VCWQELAPPDGELTAQPEGDNCHPMAPRAMTHSLSVNPPSPCLLSSISPQVLYLCYAKGTDLACMLHSSGAPFHIVVLRGTLLMRARTARCATQERKHDYDHGCAGACGSGPVAG
jgi:hypothetical protein